MKFFTIGVFHSDEEEFFKKLEDNKIDVFCDIRHRRAIRGSLYSFANSTRLQKELSERHIRYEYVKELGAPPEIRQIQKNADVARNISTRKREVLSSGF